MKVGQTFGAGTNNKVSLLCIATEIHPGLIAATVLNGNWNILFYDNVTMMQNISGEYETIECDILYDRYIPIQWRTTAIPITPSESWGFAINCMNLYLSSKWKFLLTIMLSLQQLVEFIEVFIARISLAKQAFNKSKNKSIHQLQLDNDDISF
jgi:hypothetical protein